MVQEQTSDLGQVKARARSKGKIKGHDYKARSSAEFQSLPGARASRYKCSIYLSSSMKMASGPRDITKKDAAST